MGHGFTLKAIRKNVHEQLHTSNRLLTITENLDAVIAKSMDDALKDELTRIRDEVFKLSKDNLNAAKAMSSGARKLVMHHIDL